jgi:hypothetical protein
MKRKIWMYLVVLVSGMLFLMLNLMTSNHVWWFHPWFGVSLAFAVIYFSITREVGRQAIYASIIIIIYLTLINVMYSSHHPWVLYAIYPILCWPLLLTLRPKSLGENFAWIMFIVGSCYYVALDLLLAPNVIYSFIIVYTLSWWPVSIHYYKKRDIHKYSLVSTITTITFFVLLNVLYSPQVIWAIYPIFGVMWWPMTMNIFVPKRRKI